MVGRALVHGAAVLVAMMLAIGGALGNDGYQKSDGLAVYLGIVPASLVRGHPTSHAESTMHGGAGTPRHQQHVVVAIFDADTGVRVENARVSARIAGLGHVGQQSLALEAMTVANTVTYGAFVTLSGNDRYEISLDITVPGRPRTVSVNFSSEHVQ
ncbi:MAG: hypothetical protein AB7F74_29505 [Parvibaculaceae bacterium]